MDETLTIKFNEASVGDYLMSLDLCYAFEVVSKVIDDEMEIRFAAYNAIKQLFHENSCSEEIFYNEIKEFTSFTNFSNFISSVDPSRKIKIEKNRKKIEVLFYKLSNKLSNKFKFIQPMRMNVIKNNGS